MSLTNLFSLMLKGGPTSGNFGHSGIPGKRGGSASKGGGGDYATPSKEQTDWAKNLTSTEKTSLMRYLNAGSTDINSDLREGKIRDSLAPIVKDIDSAISKMPVLKKDTIFYRAAFGEPSNIDKGFMSVMVSKKAAEIYATNGKKVYPVILKKGTKVAPVSLLYSPYSEELLVERSK